MPFENVFADCVIQLDGLGLGGIVRNILAGLGLEKVLKGMGLTGLFPSPKDEKKKTATK